jgi:hypothetical protein
MKKIVIPFISLAFLAWSCNSSTENSSGKDSVTVNIANDTAESTVTVDSVPANSQTVDSLLQKPITTPANNPFGLKVGDNLLKSGALEKEPLMARMKTILGDKFDDYKKFLKTAKVLKKDTDGFLYTMGEESKGSKNKAFFLYQHEKDVLFLGFQKGDERMMMNDMKSRLFAPEEVDQWAERPLDQ